MKNKLWFIPILLVFLTVSFSFGEWVKAEIKSTDKPLIPPSKMSKEKIEEIRMQSEKQNRLESDLVSELKKESIQLEDIRSEGDYYFNGDDQIVILVKETEKAKNKEKVKKIKERVEKLKSEKERKEEKYIIRTANYSQDELVNIITSFYEDNEQVGFSKNTSIRLNAKENRLDLITDSLSNSANKELKKKYGNLINISIDPEFRGQSEYAAAKLATDDWNSLGAGLGITLPATSTSYYNCSTAGVAYKDSRYFLITAGHCIKNIGETWQQYRKYDVGHAHLDARASDYDLGLIILDSLVDSREIPGGRYPSSGLYLVGTEVSAGGYDAHLRGTESPVENRRVCKAGIQTGYTCGRVTDTYVREWFSQIHTSVNVLPGEGTYTGNYLLAKGDSGGALFNPANFNLVGITSEVYVTGEYRDSPAGQKGLFTPFVLAAQKYNLYLYTDTTRKAISQ